MCRSTVDLFYAGNRIPSLVRYMLCLGSVLIVSFDPNTMVSLDMDNNSKVVKSLHLLYIPAA